MDSFEKRAAAAREQVEKIQVAADKRRDPAEREKVLRRAVEIVNEGRREHLKADAGDSKVLAVARFLVGEPG